MRPHRASIPRSSGSLVENLGQSLAPLSGSTLSAFGEASPAQLAAVLGVDLGSISKWEGGANPHHVVNTVKVEAFLSGMPEPRAARRRRAQTRS